ncbi:MAG: sugar ABC transporter permease [bacterium]|nr:sugar ABC transporter permease [bacterium]
MTRSFKLSNLTYTAQKKVLGYVMVLPFFIMICVLMVGIALYSLSLSFQNVDLMDTEAARFVGFETYKEVFDNTETMVVIENSLVWVLVGTVLVTLLGVSVGGFLSDNRNVFCRFGRSVMLIPWVLPGVVVAGLWKWMYQIHGGLINKTLIDLNILQEGISWLGNPKTVLYAIIAVIVWRLFPLFALVIAAAIQGIDVTLYEAGKMDGMTSWQEFVYITLPCIRYQILTTALLNMIWIMNNLVLVNVMTKGGPLYFSETLPVYMFKLGIQYAKLSQAAAVTMINFVILLALSLIYVYVFRKNQKQ